MAESDMLRSHIRSTLGDLSSLDEEEKYPSLAFCAIDAVYSIGVRYEAVLRTVSDFCSWRQLKENRAQDAGEYTLAEFMEDLRPYESRWEALADEVFRNRQRTSSRSGILKAEAVYRFAKALQRCGVNAIADLADGSRIDCCRNAIREIPGQRSGISFKYFLMLAGHDTFVKPDRMVLRYVAAALGVDVETLKPDDAEKLIQAVARELRTEFPKLTASRLDYEIWQYQRSTGASPAAAIPRSDAVAAPVKPKRIIHLYRVVASGAMVGDVEDWDRSVFTAQAIIAAGYKGDVVIGWVSGPANDGGELGKTWTVPKARSSRYVSLAEAGRLLLPKLFPTAETAQ